MSQYVSTRSDGARMAAASGGGGGGGAGGEWHVAGGGGKASRRARYLAGREALTGSLACAIGCDVTVETVRDRLIKARPRPRSQRGAVAAHDRPGGKAPMRAVGAALSAADTWLTPQTTRGAHALCAVAGQTH